MQPRKAGEPSLSAKGRCPRCHRMIFLRADWGLLIHYLKAGEMPGLPPSLECPGSGERPGDLSA